jgi:hypothetical protein
MAVAAASRCWKQKTRSQTWIDYLLPLFLLQQRAAATLLLGPNGYAPIRSVVSLAILIKNVWSLDASSSVDRMDPITSWLITSLL